jgi:hypothetical protein
MFSTNASFAEPVNPVFTEVAVEELVMKEVMIANEPDGSIIMAHHSADINKCKSINKRP